MDNTTAIKAAENLQLGLLASGPQGPGECGSGASRDMMCSIIDDMTPPIKRLMIINTCNQFWGVAGPIVIYNLQDGSMKQNEISMPIVEGACAFQIGSIGNGLFVITQGFFTMLMNINACLLQDIYAPKFIELKIGKSKGFSCGSDASMVKLHDGRLLVMNGSYWNGRMSRRSHRVFDYEKSTWGEISKNDTPNVGACCVVMLDGRVLMAGGTSETTYRGWDKCWIFNASTRKFTDTTPMIAEHSCPSGCLLPNGHVFVCGCGVICETYDPKTAKWTLGGKMIHERSNPALCLIDDQNIFISGGKYGRIQGPYGGQCEIYNLTTHTSTETAQKMQTDMSDSEIIPLYD